MIEGEEGMVQSEEHQDWEAKYKTLQGKYNAEVPRLSEELNLLKEQIAKQNELLASMTEGKDIPPELELLEEEAPELAKGIEAVVKQTVEKAVKPYLETLHKDLDTKLQSLQEVNKQKAVVDYLDKVRSSVENFDEINNSPEFQKWLTQKVHPLSTQTLYDVLKDAHSRLDSQRVAEIYNTFHKVKMSGTTPVFPPQPSSSPSSSGISPQPITVDFIQKFTADVARGRYAGRPEEMKKIQAEIDKAIMEGRIVAPR